MALCAGRGRCVFVPVKQRPVPETLLRKEINLPFKTLPAINATSFFYRLGFRSATNLLFKSDIGGFNLLSCATNAGKGTALDAST